MSDLLKRVTKAYQVAAPMPGNRWIIMNKATWESLKAELGLTGDVLPPYQTPASWLLNVDVLIDDTIPEQNIKIRNEQWL